MVQNIIYTLPYYRTRETKLQSFQTKIVHRIFACHYNLNLWSIKESASCHSCDLQAIDTLEHYFFFCTQSSNFWLEISHWWFRQCQVIIRLNAFDILFGLSNPNDDCILNIMNYLILTGKWYIFTCKNEPKRMLLKEYLGKLKNRLEIEKYIMYNKGNAEEFHRSWDILLNNL